MNISISRISQSFFLFFPKHFSTNSAESNIIRHLLQNLIIFKVGQDVARPFNKDSFLLFFYVLGRPTVI